MATKKQIAANRRNARKSTGPTSPRGKAVSRLNALRHGLRARVTLPDENLKELRQIRDLFLRSYHPQTPEQVRLVELMASANWQLRYWQRTEAKLFGDGPGTDPIGGIRTLDRLSQRQARYERAFMKAYQQYRRSTRAKPQPESDPCLISPDIIDIPMRIEKVYEPQRFEPHWAQWWIDSAVFHASQKLQPRVFSLVIPPPNVTGSLHIGHMLEHAEIDVTIRWHRMCGDNTLWLPGTDHAGIATQMVVERKLAEEGLDRRTMGRDKFIERVWEWKAQYGDQIKRQMIRLGASCDWSRERFTLDPGLSLAVREVFVRLYEKGRLVN